MKGTFLIAIIVIFSMLVIPLSALKSKQNVFVETSAPQINVTYEKSDVKKSMQKIKVLKNDEILEFDINDYIFGVVAAEMPALYEKEALKAQAVAAYTYACYKKERSDTDYDISADPQVAQCFITRDEATARWGEKAQEYAKKIDDCIAEVQGEVITYNQKPILAVFHAISSGSTNSCADVWGTDLPYLKSVDSFGDTLSDGYISQASFTAEEITDKLKDIAAADNNIQNYFSDIKTNNNGYVKEIIFCGKKTTGAAVAKALQLRSSNFEVNYADNNINFTVKGYGHGVGMSQTGADYMAKQGSTYKEILLHYYTGVKIEKI